MSNMGGGCMQEHGNDNMMMLLWLLILCPGLFNGEDNQMMLFLLIFMMGGKF